MSTSIRMPWATPLLLGALLAGLIATPALAGGSGTASDLLPGNPALAAPSTAITVISTSSNSHTCVIASDGTARCWGHNSSGQLGDGTTTERHIAVPVMKAGGANLAGVTGISAGRDSTCAVIGDGSAWCWGANSVGQLGDGTTTTRLRAARVTKAGGGYLSGVTSISTGGWVLTVATTVGSTAPTADNLTTCASTRDGGAWCWGGNAYGDLGDGTTTDRHRAVRVTRTGGGNLAGVTSVSAGGSVNCARTRDGAAWCWGGGDLGDGSTAAHHRAVRVTKAGGGNLTGVTSISTGGFFTCAATTAGAAWCWGSNYNGLLGDGSTTDRHRAVRVRTTGGGYLTGVSTISAFGFATGSGWPLGHACSSTRDGAAWCWGSSLAGELGDGTNTGRNRAARATVVGGAVLSGVVSVSAGLTHTCSLASGGTAWCWGDNTTGELGDGTTTERDQAVRVTAI